MHAKPVKIIGYGNPSRLDDGLGPAMIDALESEGLEKVELETDFQLNIEDLVGLENYSAVIFVDADVSCQPPFQFYRIEPDSDISYSSHSVSPASLLGLAESHFGISVPGYVMAIRGYEFDDFDEKLSSGARENLDAARQHLLDFLSSRDTAGKITMEAGTMPASYPPNDCEERL